MNRVPQRGVMVLGAREHQVALAVVLDERQGPLVALQQNGAHGGARVTQTPATRASVRVKEGARAEIRPQKRLAAFLGSVCETYGQTVSGRKMAEFREASILEEGVKSDCPRRPRNTIASISGSAVICLI